MTWIGTVHKFESSHFIDTLNLIKMILGSRVISWKKGDSFLFLGESSLTEDKRYSVTATSDSSTLSITLVK